MIGITMLVAHGFGKMITESGQSDAIIHWLAAHAENGRAMASFEMILIGALIAIGIGSSFSTVPIVASVYVPLGILKIWSLFPIRIGQGKGYDRFLVLVMVTERCLRKSYMGIAVGF